jgi:hypothetical protein
MLLLSRISSKACDDRSLEIEQWAIEYFLQSTKLLLFSEIT